MMELRATDARKRPGVLAACLLAAVPGEESIDRDVAALVVAETILMWRESVTK